MAIPSYLTLKRLVKTLFFLKTNNIQLKIYKKTINIEYYSLFLRRKRIL